MSYILDALKKSEQERGHGNIPDVQTIHSSSLNYRSEKKTYWPYILIAAVLLNLLAIVYFIINKQAPEGIVDTTRQTSIVTQTSIESNAPEIMPEKKELNERPAAIISSNEGKKTEVKTREADVDVDVDIAGTENIKTSSPEKTINTKTEDIRISNDDQIMEFHELSDSIKQDLPSFVISAHVYSTNPLQRSIVINNKFMEEGEYVLDGLILHEITSDGAIFNYKGTLFRYAVISGWQ